MIANGEVCDEFAFIIDKPCLAKILSLVIQDLVRVYEVVKVRVAAIKTRYLRIYRFKRFEL